MPDSTGALQTRFEFKIWDPASGEYGMDKTNILTNAADFTVRATNGQVLRVSASSSYDKDVEFSLDHDGGAAFRRWRIRVTSGTSDFQLVRYDDNGALLDAPLTIDRATGQIFMGGTSGTAAGLVIQRNGGSALQVYQLAEAGTAVSISGQDTGTRAVQVDVAGDAQRRFVVMTDGRLEWGSGASSRDVTLYRSSADVLRTDDTFHVGANLRVNTTSIGGGSGVIAIGNAATVPTSNPTGGVVLYVSDGRLKVRQPDGTDQFVALTAT